MGSMSEADQKDAMEVTKAQNIVLDKFKGNRKVTPQQIEREVRNLKFYQDATDHTKSSRANTR